MSLILHSFETPHLNDLLMDFRAESLIEILDVGFSDLEIEEIKFLYKNIQEGIVLSSRERSRIFDAIYFLKIHVNDYPHLKSMYYDFLQYLLSTLAAGDFIKVIQLFLYQPNIKESKDLLDKFINRFPDMIPDVFSYLKLLKKGNCSDASFTDLLIKLGDKIDTIDSLLDKIKLKIDVPFTQLLLKSFYVNTNKIKYDSFAVTCLQMSDEVFKKSVIHVLQYQEDVLNKLSVGFNKFDVSILAALVDRLGLIPPHRVNTDWGFLSKNLFFQVQVWQTFLRLEIFFGATNDFGTRLGVWQKLLQEQIVINFQENSQKEQFILWGESYLILEHKDFSIPLKVYKFSEVSHADITSLDDFEGEVIEIKRDINFPFEWERKLRKIISNENFFERFREMIGV
ncbi:MAG: hypothetical protein COB02_17915 [Candidatus Cloacimonadota bacterium]|nr:MAG: hypothetical protein COB02_17915 [Candidatus Cloacimonadota bacterium]